MDISASSWLNAQTTWLGLGGKTLPYGNGA
jgi:hypothetical protein